MAAYLEKIRFLATGKVRASLNAWIVAMLMSVLNQASAAPDDALSCLAKTYPDHLTLPTGDLVIVSHAGQRYPYKSETLFKNIEDELDRADLFSQLRQRYQRGSLARAPQNNEDPGRLRHMPLFLDMYGKTSSEVIKKLVNIHWAPCNCQLQFSSVNGAARALETVGKEIHSAGLSHYMNQGIGTFNWRKIAGTNRLSMHALGIAIDFKLPSSLGRYWRWDHPSGSQHRTFPIEILRDEGLNRIVDIFEANGFIWGGKWWHYDSIHFEYRPELALHDCFVEDENQ